MIVFPNAKINLGLNIVSKREDGYHNLETIFYPIGIEDALEVIEKKEASEDVFIEAGNKVDVDAENNLVMRALKLMRTKYDFPILEIHLLKNIPFGAGIGGGSADAAYMLKLINEKFALQALESELAALALQLGADCPFFIYNRPMFAKAIGEEFQEIELSLKDYYFVLVKPDVHISTKDAFLSIVPQVPEISLIEIIKLPIEKWKDFMFNDFENSIFPQFPQIREIKDKLYNLGAVYSSMSGSGSSVYGLFRQKPSDPSSVFPTSYVWVEEK